jgi:integrase
MASINKRGPYQYQALVRRKGYPSQTKTFESRPEAEAWARSVEARMDDNSFRDRRVLVKLTLSDALERYATTVTPTKRSCVAERNRIALLKKRPIAMRSLDSLLARDFSEYRDQRLKEVSATSVRLELALLSHLYTIAIKEWSLPLTHELKNVRKPKPNEARERRLVGDEYQELLAAIQRPEARCSRIWLDACVRLAVETGMRAGEILSLEWRQVDLGRGVARLDKTKNGTKRTVPLTEEAVRVLAQLPRTGVQVIGTFHDTSGLDRTFKRACEAAGIEGLRFHDLRHEAASRLAPHMKVQDLAKIMGWKTLQMAMRYYNPSDDELVALVRRAAPAANAASAGLTALPPLPKAA